MIEVKPVNEKEFGLYIDSELFGTSKLHCDAMLSKKILERYIERRENDKHQTVLPSETR